MSARTIARIFGVLVFAGGFATQSHVALAQVSEGAREPASPPAASTAKGVAAKEKAATSDNRGNGKGPEQRALVGSRQGDELIGGVGGVRLTRYGRQSRVHGVH